MTEHFSESEFACHCGCGTNLIKQPVLEALERLRTVIGKPIHINSGYRCPKHPIEAAKVAPGWHTKGLAADISVTGMGARKLYRLAVALGAFGGFGVDDEQGYLHLDLRENDARWCYSKGKEVRWHEA